jgi:hypothetical protein
LPCWQSPLRFGRSRPIHRAGCRQEGGRHRNRPISRPCLRPQTQARRRPRCTITRIKLRTAGWRAASNRLGAPPISLIKKNSRGCRRETLRCPRPPRCLREPLRPPEYRLTLNQTGCPRGGSRHRAQPVREVLKAHRRRWWNEPARSSLTGSGLEGSCDAGSEEGHSRNSRRYDLSVKIRPPRPPGPLPWNWSRGRWRWNGGRWVWISGSWRWH